MSYILKLLAHSSFISPKVIRSVTARYRKGQLSQMAAIAM